MRSARVVVLFSLVVAALAGTGSKRSGDFPNRTESEGLAIGARLLTEDEVKNGFFSDVYRKFLVVEVAMEPTAGAAVKVERSQFALRMEANPAIVAQTPGAAAETLRAAAQSSKSVKLTPRSQVGYRTGDPRPPYQRNDPFEDPTVDRRKGVYTRSGVDVTWGEPAAGSTPADRQVMETELTDKEIPLGKIQGAVSGFLYFAKPDGKVGTLKLEFRGASGAVALEL